MRLLPVLGSGLAPPMYFFSLFGCVAFTDTVLSEGDDHHLILSMDMMASLQIKSPPLAEIRTLSVSVTGGQLHRPKLLRGLQRSLA